MIGVDTNILLRILVEDDPAQLRAGIDFVNSGERAEARIAAGYADADRELKALAKAA